MTQVREPTANPHSQFITHPLGNYHRRLPQRSPERLIVTVNQAPSAETLSACSASDSNAESGRPPHGSASLYSKQLLSFDYKLGRDSLDLCFRTARAGEIV
jgi:hypothetical protein